MASSIEHPVQLYVYDLSHGLAAQLSPQLLGKQINGIWHTAIIVYGTEYFFGAGINRGIPGQTYHGRPLRIEDLGTTTIPREVFEEFIAQLSADRFRHDKYHLLDHNCNTFTTEAAQFLVGRSIPDYIRGLPREFLNTPFGQMMRPYIDAMFSPQGPGLSGAVMAGDRLSESLQSAFASPSATPTSIHNSASATSPLPSTDALPPFCYEHGSVAQICNKLRSFVGELDSVPFELSEAIMRAEKVLTSAKDGGDVTAAKLRITREDMTGMAARALADVAIASLSSLEEPSLAQVMSAPMGAARLPVERLFPLLDILRLLSMHPPSHAACTQAFVVVAQRLLLSSTTRPSDAVRLTALRLGVNVLGSTRLGATAKSAAESTVNAEANANGNNSNALLDADVYVRCAVSALVDPAPAQSAGTVAAIRQAATALAYDIAVVFGAARTLDLDAAAEVSAALCHVVESEEDNETAYRAVSALVAFGKDATVAELIGTLSPNVNRLAGISDRHAKLCAQFNRVFASGMAA